jgi:hypothetical protein
MMRVLDRIRKQIRRLAVGVGRYFNRTIPTLVLTPTARLSPSAYAEDMRMLPVALAAPVAHLAAVNCQFTDLQVVPLGYPKQYNTRKPDAAHGVHV